MRYFRRLPPLLRAASIVGLLFVLAAIALLLTYLAIGPYAHRESSKITLIAVNLTLLGQACSTAVNCYSTRFRWPDRRQLPLDSWQSQVRVIALLSVLPLCAIALALVVPSTSFALVVVFLISLAAGIVEIVVGSVGMANGALA
jgi:hypothetical protein